MSVLLMVAMFGLFIALDLLLSRGKATVVAAAGAPALPATPAAPEPVWVAGYQLPEGLHYHRGHTWARVLDPRTLLIGIDDFARRLTGPARGVSLPAVGSWVRQGAPGFEVGVDGRRASFIAPAEGEVVEVNRSVDADPDLVTKDPYGRGWLMKVRVKDMGSNLRNLMSGSLARRWMQDSREGLELRLMALSGSVLQDGGERVDDFARHLSDDEWKRLIGEFLLT
jgi:glycine cleavage system H protein